jgi:hypothetical protein
VSWKSPWLTGIVAVVAVVAGFGVGYVIDRPVALQTSSVQTVRLNGTVYDYQNVSWRQPEVRLNCGQDTVGLSIPPMSIALVPWDGAVFEVTQLQESCPFPGASGSFVFNATVSVAAYVPSAGLIFQTYTGDLVLANTSSPWSSLLLLVDSGQYGILFVSSVASPLPPIFAGPAGFDCTFWLLAAA